MSLKRAVPLVVLLLALLSLLRPAATLAQDRLKVVIHGEPRQVDGQVEASISVVSPGGALSSLPPDAFVVRENNRPIDPAELRIEPSAAGIGLVILIDRGGIAARNSCLGPTNQMRISEAKIMATGLVNGLVIQAEGEADDMVAIIGVDPKDANGIPVMWPNQDFSYNPVDRNLALNALEPLDDPGRLLRDPSVTTPLYEGLYRAFDLLTANSDLDIRQALAKRQRMIVVFSDGIDQGYSDAAIESDILRLADEHQVIIHTVGLACRDGSRLVENSLRRLAAQSQGSFWRHGSAEEHATAVTGLQTLATYRQQYKLSFPSRVSSGTHRLSIQVTTEGGADEASASFISALQTPRLTVTGTPNGYTLTEDNARQTTLPFTAEIEFVDGVERGVTVTFSVNETAVVTLSAPPYQYDWELDQLGIGAHRLQISATDSLLGEVLREERTIQISAAPPTPTPPPTPGVIGPTDSAPVNALFWIIPILLILIIALFILLYRTQSGVRQAVAASARNVRSTTTKLTQKLGPSKPPLAKLVMARGPNFGEEYRLTENITRFGREADRCDKVLPAPYVSSLHFSIMFDSAQRVFFIMDHRSTNGTYLNRQPLPPETYHPLPLGSVISIGQNHEIEMSFQTVIRTTRVLGPMNP